MKIFILTSVAALIFLAGASVSAQPVFSDNYWGGDPTSNNGKYQADVIGETGVFDLTGYNVQYDSFADVLSVQVHGNYFDDLINNSSDLLDTTMGDLFISTDGLAWEDGEAATLDDYFGQSGATMWEYAASLGTYDNSQGELDGVNKANPENGGLYAINDPSSEIKPSSVGGGGIFRENQEVRYTGQTTASLAPVEWFFSDDHSFLQISIQDAGSMFGDAEEIGFHWTMSCGNDVLEFSTPQSITPVPEPSLIGALGIGGLLGYLGLRRHRSQCKRS